MFLDTIYATEPWNNQLEKHSVTITASFGTTFIIGVTLNLNGLCTQRQFLLGFSGSSRAHSRQTCLFVSVSRGSTDRSVFKDHNRHGIQSYYATVGNDTRSPITRTTLQMPAWAINTCPNKLFTGITMKFHTGAFACKPVQNYHQSTNKHKPNQNHDGSLRPSRLYTVVIRTWCYRDHHISLTFLKGPK